MVADTRHPHGRALSPEPLALASTVTRFFVAGVLLVAGVAKLADRASFARAVAAYEVLPRRATRFVSRSLPFLECAAALLLVAGISLVPVSIVVALVLATFAFANSVLLLRGRVVDCGCFGAARTPISWGHVTGTVLLSSATLFQGFIAAGVRAEEATVSTLAAGVAGTAWVGVVLLIPQAVTVRRQLRARVEGSAST